MSQRHGVPVSDHPRMGGEKSAQLSAVLSHSGSPPHGRGKGVLDDLQRVAVGITPAWAGKSCRAAAASTRGRDHPRMGGEKSIFTLFCGFS